MKKTLKMLFGFLCLLSAMVFALSGCDMQNMFGGPVEVPKEDGVTPVYYGMLMSTSPNVEIPSVSYEEAAKGNTNNNGNHNGWYKDNNGNNGNHYGWYKDDNGDGKLDDDFQQQICYVSQNQDVYFYVGIGNPAGLQIVSIKINGKTYTSDMFEKNSTNEVKILKYNVGNAHGIVEYTIEEIKYSDGTEVKDVVVAGNKTARAGIKIENAVMATVNTIELKDSGKEIFFDITIADDHGLIANSNGTITITIYRDGKSVKDAKLVVGKNEVTIKTLNKNKEHQYEIVAYYDDFSGEGATYHTLVSRRPVQEIHTHTFGAWTVTQEASCFVDGEKIRTCSVCGEIETEIISAPDKHTWGEWEIVKDATCVEDGAKKHTCSACGENETDIIPATGEHSFGEWATTKKATCTENGEKMRTCSACDKTEIETILALGHNYVNRVCSECGDEFICEVHSYMIDYVNNPARFENRWGVCEVCGYVDEYHEHILENGTCKYCDWFELYELQVESIFDFDQNGKNEVFTMANTLYEKFRAEDAIHINGVKGNLGKNYMITDWVADGELWPPYPHVLIDRLDKDNSYLLYNVTVEETGIYEVAIHTILKSDRYRGATIIVNGEKALEFSYGWKAQGGTTLSEEYMLLYSNDIVLRGTYIYGITLKLQKGINEIKIIAPPEECEYSMHIRDLYFVKATDLPSDEHSFGEWATTKKATCTENGEKTRTCSACGKTEIESIPALGHNYVNLVCSECGKTASCEDGHSYQIDLFNNPARFENRWGVCEFCGYIDELHEHILQNGKCKYCDEFELHEVQFKSVFDFDKDGQKDVFTMANTLPEKFRAEDAIHISASKANLSEICTTYDEVRAGWENPMPYVHHFVNEQDKENSYLLYKITVEEAGIYELGIHIRLKDARYRGATFWVNGTKALEFSYGWTSKEPLSLSDAQLALRSNDLLKGSYIYGITIELEKGENVIKITSPEECSHSMHFRDFYFVKKQTTPPVEHEHEWVKSITPPTATANGVITYTCSCGDSYTETIVPTDFTVTAENRAMIGFTGEANEKLVIPAVFEDNGTWYRVTSIGICAFYGCSGLASVTIPDTVATIDGYAFGGCSNLTSVTIGDSVTTISGTAFWCCSNLTSVIIPDSVTTIGYEAFAGCSNLTSVTIGKSVTTIGESAFRNCSRLTSIVIDEKNIAYQSINGNLYSKDGTLLIAYALGKIDTHFQIPDSVTTIGDWAFSGCSSLTSVTVGDSVTSIGDFAFCDCDAITHVYYVGTESKWANISIGGYNDNVLNATRYYYSATQPTEEGNFWHYVDGVPTVWEVEIHKHSYTSTVTKEPTATENGVITYTCSCTDSYTEELVPQDFIITPDNRAMIGFTGEANENFVIPAVFEDNGTWYRVTTIGNFAFSDCSNITNVTIGNSVTTIGNLAFYYCSSLTSVTIGNSVTTIGDAAFSYCSNLTSVTIPDSVTAIGSSAFSGCSSLTSVKISDFVTIIGDYTFSSCSSLTSVTIPNSVTIIGDYTFSGCSSLTSVTIPNSVTTIGSRAFSGCFSLASVTIGDSVTTIGSSAFQVCSSLTSVTIPNSVTIIGDWAFAHCDNLTSVTIPDSVTIIGDWAFAYCNSLTSLTIGNSVTTIGDWAFAYCNSLTSLTIGNSVTTIGDYAFYSCYSLTTVYYIGTEEDWNNIAINNEDNSNSDLLNATRYYYSATQPTTEGNFWHYVDGVPTVWDTHVEPEIPDYSEGLEFISNGDGTCYVLIYNCKDSNVKIPYLSPDGDTVTAIKTLAIGMLSPDSVFIPQTVTHIDSGLFGFELSGCKKYIVAEENSSFKSIEDTLYSKDGKTLLHYAYGDKAHFTIPDGVEFIGANAFWGVGGLITNIVLPNDITSIGRSAFNGCHSLTHIYYMGTEETWIAISIDEYNTPLTNATRYYYSETQPTTEGNYWHYVDGVPTAW